MSAGPLELVRKRRIQKQTLISIADKNTNLLVRGMFVRANDPSTLFFADCWNGKVKQMDLHSLQVQTIYSTIDASWSVLNVSEVDQNTLIICERNISKFLFSLQLSIHLFSENRVLHALAH